MDWDWFLPSILLFLPGHAHPVSAISCSLYEYSTGQLPITKIFCQIMLNNVNIKELGDIKASIKFM